MIICSCHVITDHEVREAFSQPEPPRSMSHIYEHIGHEPHCGRCVRSVRDIMREHGCPRRQTES